ncbi:MAG: M20 family metallopeptidase, partial [Acidithiobacillus sp.]
MEQYLALARRFFEEMIRFETVNPPGNEQPLAEYVTSTMKAYGFDTQVQPVAPGRANALVRLGNSPNKLIFNGHLDVVPAGEGWKHDPFVLTEEDGLLYGRGACDMKGALAAMMAAAIKIKQEGTLRGQELILLFVADEEIDGAGAKAFVRSFEKGSRNWVIIGEGTENQLHVAHRGVVRLRITLTGRQCHAGQPEKGINANTMMARFLLAVDRVNQEKQSLHQQVLPPPSVSATRVNGGIKDNVVPGSCETVLDFRTVPGETAQSLVAQMDELLHRLFQGQPEVSWGIEPFIEVKPGMTEPTAPLVQATTRAYHDLFGTEPQITYFGACCDMSCFTA